MRNKKQTENGNVHFDLRKPLRELLEQKSSSLIFTVFLFKVVLQARSALQWLYEHKGDTEPPENFVSSLLLCKMLFCYGCLLLPWDAWFKHRLARLYYAQLKHLTE